MLTFTTSDVLCYELQRDLSLHWIHPSSLKGFYNNILMNARMISVLPRAREAQESEVISPSSSLEMLRTWSQVV